MKQTKTKSVNSRVEPIKLLPIIKVDRDDNGVFYFVETPGNLDKTRFVQVSQFKNFSGVWLSIVQKLPTDNYQLMNVYGELSDQLFNNQSEILKHTCIGKKITFGGKEIVPKRFKDDNGFYFMLPDGTQTKRFKFATEFDDEMWRDVSLVQMKESSGYRILNNKGELSDDRFSGKYKALKAVEIGELHFTESALLTQSELEADLTTGALGE